MSVVNVPAYQFWTRTGVILEKKNSIKINASGLVSTTAQPTDLGNAKNDIEKRLLAIESDRDIHSVLKLKAELAKPSLLILDDFGLGDIGPQVAQVLLDVVDRRMRSGSLLITSQYPTDQWHALFLDPTIADAILDRVVQQSHRLSLKGDSMRKLNAKQRMLG